jgi:hypothetical protein
MCARSAGPVANRGDDCGGKERFILRKHHPTLLAAVEYSFKLGFTRPALSYRQKIYSRRRLPSTIKMVYEEDVNPNFVEQKKKWKDHGKMRVLSRYISDTVDNLLLDNYLKEDIRKYMRDLSFNDRKVTLSSSIEVAIKIGLLIGSVIDKN